MLSIKLLSTINMADISEIQENSMYINSPDKSVFGRYKPNRTRKTLCRKKTANSAFLGKQIQFLQFVQNEETKDGTINNDKHKHVYAAH